MVRFYDRIRRRNKLSAVSPEAQQIGSHDLQELQQMTVVVVDEAVRYFYELAGKDEWRTAEDIMPFFPMFDIFWIETRAPRKVVDSKGEDLGVHNFEIPASWGAVVRAKDLKKEFAGSENGWQEAGREHLEREFSQLGYTLKIVTGVRWVLSFNLYIEDSPTTRALGVRTPFGPYASMVIGLQELGSPAEFDNGSMVRAVVSLMSKNPVQDKELLHYHATNAAWLINPLCFALFLANCKKVNVVESGPPQKSRKKAEKTYGVPTTRYHTLDIEPMRDVFDTGYHPVGTGQRTAFHWVRMHTRVYLPGHNRPFGRDIEQPEIHVIPSHSRGDTEQGTVAKGYNVNEPKEEIPESYKGP